MHLVHMLTRCKHIAFGFFATLALAISLASLPATAKNSEQSRPGTDSRPILEVTVTGSAERRTFTVEQLKDLGVAKFVTSTPWTKQSASFEGVRLKDLLQALGVRSGTIKAIALNDYAAEVPVQDAFDHDSLLAFSMNATPLSPRDKGPLWIIYPFDDDPSLRREVIYSRSVWQLNRLEIRP